VITTRNELLDLILCTPVRKVNTSFKQTVRLQHEDLFVLILAGKKKVSMMNREMYFKASGLQFASDSVARNFIMTVLNDKEVTFDEYHMSSDLSEGKRVAQHSFTDAGCFTIELLDEQPVEF